MTEKRAQRRRGQVCKFDFQSDIYRREYVLIKSVGGGTWIAEYAPVSDEAFEQMIADGASESEIMHAIEETGGQFKIKFVTRKQFSKYF